MTAMASTTPSYVAPRSVAVALAAVADGDAAVLGGGTIVMAQRARGDVTRSRLVDLAGIEDLGRVTETATAIGIGSTVTYAALLRSPGPVVPLLPAVCRGVTGGPQIRGQATLGGSACYANPASDVPTALVALGASMIIDGPLGRRAVPAAGFFQGAFRTDLRRGEVLVGMEVPRRGAVGWGYAKLKASESSWPIVTAAACLELAGSEGTAVVTVGGAADAPASITIPWSRDRDRVEQSDRLLIDDHLAAAVATWWEDELADSRYRRRVAGIVGARAVEAALAEGGS
jgi:CO/xanthine dehydrogenase FAD-binding subunit